MLFSKAIELFCENLVVQGKSQNTIDNYIYYLTNFNKYLCLQYNRQLYIDEIKPEDLEKYIFNKLNQDRYSSSARHGMITAFKSLYSFCHRKKYCGINIGRLIKNEKVRTKERDYINEMEFVRISKQITTSPTTKAVISTLFYTGLRISECLSLTLDDIDLEHDVIRVKQGKGNKDRNIPINNRLKKVLKDYLDIERFYVGTENFFASKSGKICAQLINRMLKKATKAAGINKNVSCHILRHSFASNLVERGIDILRVQKLLGHESIKTTTVYLHTGFDELQEAVNLL